MRERERENRKTVLEARPGGRGTVRGDPSCELKQRGERRNEMKGP